MSQVAAAAAMRLVALDVGATSMKGAVLDGDLLPQAEVRRATNREAGPDAVVAAVLEALTDLCAMPTAAGATTVGLVVPGIVDSSAGTAVWSENLRWRSVPLRAIAESHLGKAVALGNDVRAGGLAETGIGAARDARDALVLTLGTGVAAALLVDGRILEAAGYAGEIGHVDAGHDERCRCGRTGCIEAVSSAAAIERRYRSRAGLGDDPPVTAEEIVARARFGDAAAQAVWREAIGALAKGLTAAVSLLSPEVVVLGGGLALAGEELRSPLARALEASLTFERSPRLVTSTLGDTAGCLGAGLMARDLVGMR